jgi:hypothetical protein
VRGVFDEPDLAALPGAVRAVLGDPRHRRVARGLAAAIDALPPVDDAVGLLAAPVP